MTENATPTPGADGDQTGENLCPDCGGEGSSQGQSCATCEGTGRTIEPIGDA